MTTKYQSVTVRPMKTYQGVKVQLHSYLILAPDGVRGLLHCPADLFLWLPAERTEHEATCAWSHASLHCRR